MSKFIRETPRSCCVATQAGRSRESLSASPKPQSSWRGWGALLLVGLDLRRRSSRRGSRERARVGGLGRLLPGPVLRRVRPCLRQLEAAELRPHVCRLRLQLEVALERGNRPFGVALRLVRGREVAVALDRVLLDFALRLRDGIAPPAAEDAGVELAQAVSVAGAHADSREPDREDEREQRVQPLLAAPQLHEEELLVRVAAAAVLPPATPRLRRLRLGLLRLLLRLDRCARHQPPRVAEAGAAFAWRRSKSAASQIE